MRIEELIPSMFHRRLLLLLTAIALPFTVLILQLSRLTFVKGAEMREQAEQRLTRKQWTPTVRGRVLDRKGRILAIDKPSYSLAVDFRVITGEWASQQASAAARRSVGNSWFELNPDQRKELVASFQATYLNHLDNAWNILASRLGVPREELDARRDRVIMEVGRKYDAAARSRVESALREARERQDEKTQDVIRPLLTRAEIDDDILTVRIAEALASARAAGDTFAEVTLKSLDKSVRQPIVEQRSPQIIATNIEDSRAFALDLLSQEVVTSDLQLLSENDLAIVDPSRVPEVPVVPGVKLVDSGDRVYPYENMQVEVDRTTLPSPLRSADSALITVEGVACHILGRVRDKIFAEDAGNRREFLDRYPELSNKAMLGSETDRGAYREGDRVGDTGIEGSQENYLRGLRGMQIRHLETGDVETVDASKGRDVTLTLDVMLQARVQAAMSTQLGLAVVQPWHGQESATQIPGTPLNGAAVVLDIDTGDILALVSTPTFTRERIRNEPDSVFKDPLNVPYMNRAIAMPYPPGSIVKPLILAESATQGLYRTSQRIGCTGHLLEDKPNMYRCWIFKRFQMTHNQQLGGELSGDDAIMCSCNIFFFTLGRRLDTGGIVSAYKRFGVGQSFGLGIGIESQGHIGFIPKGGNKSPDDGSDLTTPDAIMMGIGQGPVAWTPLHAANAYATLARRGVAYAPRIIMGDPRPDPADLALDQSAVDMALTGLSKSVNEQLGTGNHTRIGDHDELNFNATGVKIWGKTGTADAPDLFIDPDRGGPRAPYLAQEGDHSWFVILVGEDRPRYAVSVIVEYGGSGGKVSGPICNQIVHALKAEGYLP
jgi:cell division protein FtsI/penicillin-binding protein 2